MNRPLLTLASFVAIACCSLALFADPAAAQNNSTSISLTVYYAKRSATHIGSGYTYTQSYGPYDTLEQAEAMRDQLNENRSSLSYGYGEAYVTSGLNPMFQRTFLYDPSWVYRPWLQR